MQYYKGDELEKKVDEVFAGTTDGQSAQLDLFFADVYNCQAFGDIINDNDLSPLANAIKKEIFRETFNEIFNAFIEVGTGEAYLTVFRKVFGEEVTVNFTVPAPGKLEIEILADGIVLNDMLAAQIINNDYVYTEITDHEGTNIALQTVKGFQSQYELEKMLFEMVVGGVYTTISLTLGV